MKIVEGFDNVYTMEDSPILMRILTKLRDKNTDMITFRNALTDAGMFLAYEVAKTFNVKKIPIETPITKTTGIELEGIDNIVLITVLRAAIPFSEGILRIFPFSAVGFISASRGKPPRFDVEVKYIKVPKIKSNDIVIISDPMIATGSTLVKVIKTVLSHGEMPRRLMILGLIAAPEGIMKIKKEFPNAEIFVVAIDTGLNHHGYIIPGLGDAGDRAFILK